MFLDDAQLPLYEIKANLFKALAHPARIRALEILVDSPGQKATVAQLLMAMDIEASHLSQHLRVLRRHGVVTSQRRASHVDYTLAHPGVAELLAIARQFLHDRTVAGSGTGNMAHATAVGR
ncbi:MAG TPA: metalloregulator ArsR/SmtB family transcription factor [Arthrobacter sp.]|nr:metalloregulator ArsR/SmtB family transcription factor [Arthrobacter sp.]